MKIHPNLTFFGITPYVFWTMIGCFSVIEIFSYFLIKSKMRLRLPFFLLFSSFLGMITGARVFAIIASKIYFINTGNHVHGGMVFYGGLFGFSVVYRMLQQLMFKGQSNFFWDCAAVFIPLFHGFGRIGCAFSGCCFGVEWDKVYLIYSDGIKRFPVQLLGAVLEFSVFLVLIYLFCRKKFKGRLIRIYLLLYTIGRFCVEFLRGDEIRGMIGPLSFAQICSIILLTAMLLSELKSYCKRKV